ncbi:MAG TPA: flagellar biosynthetic protein FliQ [Clostridiaceae bacterium]|jgi:flagellar biosynthetic protein FliQ|nr:flagellar biosynthetic protein FliQ [Clostridiaceae bacterium]HBG39046.1 flagellar biosynthetic protein FliQ [Clostridiaceae bacterium]HBN27657.1 flagellar biosynthetic protein FliQ [Clostridiaceae bacterium]HBX49048.1 flagellar biosynthetic protein FliQ [Clostridiaceae bacterium]HCL50576.1 flagellar biosynthetic protein FliQ [Clostridiaceae bacterium]
MTDTFLISIAKESLLTALKVAAPVLIVSMLVGLLVSILQAVTQIQEQTLTFVPKMIAIVIVFLILGPWMVRTLVNFTEYMINSIIYVVK